MSMFYPQQWNELPKHQRRKRIKKLKKQNEKRHRFLAKIRSLTSISITILLLTGSIYFWQTNREMLPPTNSDGHIESSPAKHILDTPMSIAVQKHMLEHSDGSGPPGIIINYNCEDFICEVNTIQQLKQIVQRYPLNVYLAPYPKMSVKIAITKHGKIQTLDKVDEKTVTKFIEGN